VTSHLLLNLAADFRYVIKVLLPATWSDGGF